MVLMPPRHGKSELVSLRFPCWYLAKHPEDLIVQTGYAESIALTHSRRARDIFVSPAMTALFPQIHYRPERAAQEQIIPERQAAHEWGTVQRGSYYAVGVGGGLTGRGFNLGIIDDPVKDAEEAASQTIREKIWEWYTTVFRTRAHPNAAIILVMTRWHHDDLAGRLLYQAAHDTSADQWEVLHMKALLDGKALWPERYSVEMLEAIRSSIGSRVFAALYQGEPSVASGQIFRREWWKTYREAPVFMRIIQSWDTAFKEKQQNDFSACTVWGEAENGLYLLDAWRGKLAFPELKRTVVQLYNRDHAAAILVEDKASGQSLIQELVRKTRLPVLPIRVDRDKVARAEAVTPSIEAGRVFIPESAPWLHDYIDELSAFPNAEHDDWVDSTTQAINWFNRQPAGATIVTYDSMVEVEKMIDMRF